MCWLVGWLVRWLVGHTKTASARRAWASFRPGNAAKVGKVGTLSPILAPLRRPLARKGARGAALCFYGNQWRSPKKSAGFLYGYSVQISGCRSDSRKISGFAMRFLLDLRPVYSLDGTKGLHQPVSLWIFHAIFWVPIENMRLYYGF